ncbi:MAG: hypothetical protein R3A52_09335 [Polyangiales bacterium]
MSGRWWVAPFFALGVALFSAPAWAIINQVDGTVVPDSDTLQTCLNKSNVASTSNPAPGEGNGVLNAVAAAAVTPQTFVPAPRSDGRRVAQFTMVGEGAGYQNRFGWYNVGDSPSCPRRASRSSPAATAPRPVTAPASRAPAPRSPPTPPAPTG